MPKLIDKYEMAGDGAQAPLTVFLLDRRDDKYADTDYWVGVRNDNDGGAFSGTYCDDLLNAKAAFRRKVETYDPTGHLAFGRRVLSDPDKAYLIETLPKGYNLPKEVVNWNKMLR